nr:unnamed protein product [Spirometra erinaceieuropaei]
MSIVVLPADKGRSTVVLDKTDYIQKANNLLDGRQAYLRCDDEQMRKLLTQLDKTLAEMQRNKVISKSVRLVIKPTDATAPRFYGLPKVHKVDVLLRPIVSLRGAPTFNLAKWLFRHLRPLTSGATTTLQSTPYESEQPVLWAIEAGCRHIDCAHAYQNEVEVGDALKEKFDDGTLKREDIFITSKLWCNAHRLEDVRPACEESLRRLGLRYLDLYLIHFPVPFKIKKGKQYLAFDPDSIEVEYVPLEETWKGMEELVEAGLVRSIGVSNFNKSQIDRILAVCKIPPAVNQIEVSVNWLNQKLIDYCHSKGIQITAYAPFGSPGAVEDIPSPLNAEYVENIAQAHRKTPAQVLLRHAVQRGLSVVANSSKAERIKAMFNIFKFTLTKEEMEILNTHGRNIRAFTMPMAVHHPEYPFNAEF